MAGLRIEGNISGNVAEVTTNNELKVALQSDIETAGYATILSEIDDGYITGTPLRLQLEASEDYRLRVGVDTFLFDESFPGTALNSALWASPVTTMTITVADNFLNLNAGDSTASGAVARVSSYRHFPLYGASQTHIEMLIQFSQTPVTNNICEWGFGIATGTTTPTDGAFFRLNSAGEFRAVVNANGTELQSASLNFSTLVGTNTTKKFTISLGDTSAYFWISDILVTTIDLSAAGSALTSSNNLPILFRNYNTAATSAAQRMRVSYTNVSLGDWNTSKQYSHQMVGAGRHCSMAQTGSASYAQNTVWTNSANPSAAAPTNTTAALGSGLGGIFIAKIDSLAVTTDYIISSYRVPAGSATFPGKSLYITGVNVSAVNTGAANGAGPTTWALALAYSHTTVSLVTSESGPSSSKAPRRIPIGVQSLAANAAIGDKASSDINITFQSPVLAQQGEFVQIIIRFITNNSSASEALNFYIGFDGYFE